MAESCLDAARDDLADTATEMRKLKHAYDRGMTVSSVFAGAYPSNIAAGFPATIRWIRANTPRDAVFLASDLASYVTGAVVACHGGGEPPVFLHIVQNQGADK